MEAIGQQVLTTGEQFDLKPARGRATMYFRQVTLSVQGSQVTFSGQRLDDAVIRRSRKGGAIFVVCVMVILLGMIPGAMLSSQGEQLGGFILLVLLLGVLILLVSSIVWTIRMRRARRKGIRPYSMTLPVSNVTNARVLYDWDLGCALMLLLSVPVGLLITMIRGKRLIRMQAPFDQAAVPNAVWSFKAHTIGEAQRLVYLFGPGRAPEAQPRY